MWRYSILLASIRIESTDGNFGTHEKVAIPIPIVTCTLSIPIPIFGIFVFPFPWGMGIPFPCTSLHQTLFQVHCRWYSSCLGSDIRCCLTTPLEQSSYTYLSTRFVLGHLPRQTENVFNCSRHQRSVTVDFRCCVQIFLLTYLFITVIFDVSCLTSWQLSVVLMWNAKYQHWPVLSWCLL